MLNNKYISILVAKDFKSWVLIVGGEPNMTNISEEKNSPFMT